jgi:hypothetical protein
MTRSQFTRAILCSLLLAIASPSFAASSVLWDESVSGDVSNDPTAPTQMNVSLGTNQFIATMPGSDLDFITIHVPANSVLSAIYNSVYDSIDQVSFAAIGPGTSIPATVLNEDPTGLLGYAHFGPGATDPADNLLTIMSQPAFGVPGFATPLPSGAYSVWIQQQSPVAESYQLDFVVDAVPEPATSALLLVGVLVASCRRRR